MIQTKCDDGDLKLRNRFCSRVANIVHFFRNKVRPVFQQRRADKLIPIQVLSDQRFRLGAGEYYSDILAYTFHILILDFRASKFRTRLFQGSVRY